MTMILIDNDNFFTYDHTFTVAEQQYKLSVSSTPLDSRGKYDAGLTVWAYRRVADGAYNSCRIDLHPHHHGMQDAAICVGLATDFFASFTAAVQEF